MYVYHIYISSQIIVTSPDVTPVSLPGLVLLLVLYPTVAHTHTLNEDVLSQHSILIWLYTVHLDSNMHIYMYIYSAKESDWLSCIDVAWKIYYHCYIRDFTNVFVFSNVSQHVQTLKAVSFTSLRLKDSYYAASSTSPRISRISHLRSFFPS